MPVGDANRADVLLPTVKSSVRGAGARDDVRLNDDAKEDPSTSERNENYVGYKHPPKHTRFKKGVSGNAGGKKRGTTSHATMVRKIVDEKVSVNEGGKRRKMSRFEFSLRRVVEKAMKGDAKALQLIISMMETGESPDAAKGYTLTAEDKHIIDTLAVRMRRERGTS